MKYGFGINLEQQLSRDFRVFARGGWNDGRHESFAYTEVDQTFVLGGDYRGDRWHRDHDKVGLAFVTNGISSATSGVSETRRPGLSAWATERSTTAGKTSSKGTITPISGAAYMERSIFSISTTPGYNRDRGPVWVPAVRLHIEL